MTILITGSAGVVGRTLMHHWQGRDLVGIDRRGSDHDLDLTREGPIEAFGGVSVVIHLAADPRPASPFASAAKSNIAMLLNVIDNCLRFDVRRLVYASSVWADWATWGLAEQTTWYAASKIAGEALIHAWADQTSHPAACLRLGHFAPHIQRSDDFDECLRVDAASLCRHFDLALDWNGPGCVTRYAMGKLVG